MVEKLANHKFVPLFGAGTLDLPTCQICGHDQWQKIHKVPDKKTMIQGTAKPTKTG